MYVPKPHFRATVLNWHGGYQLLFLDREDVEVLDPREERNLIIRSKLHSILVERMGSGLGPRANQNKNLVRPLPPPGDGRTLMPITERDLSSSDTPSLQSPPPPIPGPKPILLMPITERDLNSSGTGTDPPSLQSPPPPIPGPKPILSIPGLRSVPNGSPPQSGKFQKRPETNQDSPTLQTDAVLGEPLLPSPASLTPSHDLDVDPEGSAESGGYRSSFAPSKQALERMAKSRAQKAAHHAVVRHPGKRKGGNGGVRGRLRWGGWGESTDEEEEDEDEDDEEVDSDGDPVAPRHDQGPGVGPGRNFDKVSTPGSPYNSTTDLDQTGRGRPRRQSPQPPPPGRGYGMCLLRSTLVS